MSVCLSPLLLQGPCISPEAIGDVGPTDQPTESPTEPNGKTCAKPTRACEPGQEKDEALCSSDGRGRSEYAKKHFVKNNMWGLNQKTF